MVDFRYELIERIGRDGDGTVWLANDWRLGRDVALKRPGLADDLDPETADRLIDAFIANASTAMTLNHPHLVTIRDAAEDREGPYVVMEYLKAPALSSLADGMQPARILEFGGQISNGLSALHRTGVVHGDVKPENILIDSLGAVLVDFGWSELGTVPDTSPTSLLAPEVLAGETPGPASDIYSLGAALDRLLQLHQPDDGGVADEVDQLLQSAMNPNPAKRPDATTLSANLFSLAKRNEARPDSGPSTDHGHVDTPIPVSEYPHDSHDDNPVELPLVEGNGSTILGEDSPPDPMSSTAPALFFSSDTTGADATADSKASISAPLSSTVSSTPSDELYGSSFETPYISADYSSAEFQTPDTGDFEPSAVEHGRTSNRTNTAIIVAISAMVLMVAGLIVNQLTNTKQENYTSVQAVPDAGAGGVGSRPSGEEPSTGGVDDDSDTAESGPDKMVVASTPSTMNDALTTTSLKPPPSTASTTTEAPTTASTTNQSSTATEATTTTAAITTQSTTTTAPTTRQSSTTSALTTSQSSTTTTPTTTAGRPINLARESRPNQSTVDYGGKAIRAIDGNTNGQWGAASTTGTRAEVHPWWQTDLGFPAKIQKVVLYNRSDCCSDRLSNFSVFVSETSMRGKSFDQLIGDRSISRFHVDKVSGRSVTIPVDTSGQYVRIQLESPDQQILSLAEVEIIGVPE